MAEKELAQLEKVDERDEERERAFQKNRISQEEEQVKHQQRLVDALRLKEKKMADIIEEELNVLEAEVAATGADEKAVQVHLDALISEASGEETYKSAAKRIGEADKHAVHEKEKLGKEQAENVAKMATQRIAAAAEKLRRVEDSIKTDEVPEAMEFVGEAEAKVLSEMQKNEEAEQEAFAEELEMEEQEQQAEGLKAQEDAPAAQTEEEKAAQVIFYFNFSPNSYKMKGDQDEADDAKALLFLSGDPLIHLKSPRRRHHKKDIVDDFLDDLKPIKFSVDTNDHPMAESLDAEPQAVCKLGKHGGLIAHVIFSRKERNMMLQTTGLAINASKQQKLNHCKTKRRAGLGGSIYMRETAEW